MSALVGEGQVARLGSRVGQERQKKRIFRHETQTALRPFRAARQIAGGNRRPRRQLIRLFQKNRLWIPSDEGSGQIALVRRFFRVPDRTKRGPLQRILNFVKDRAAGLCKERLNRERHHNQKKPQRTQRSGRGIHFLLFTLYFLLLLPVHNHSVPVRFSH